MQDPTCCGEPMQADEYDTDEDAYRYICQQDPSHVLWFTDEDEVWK